MKKAFYFEAKNDQEVDIHIFGVIGVDEAYWNEGTNNTAYALVSMIKRLDKTYSRINVHINSPGGYIDDGLAIFNTLKAAKAEIHTYNSGLVASMASIIMLAGKTHFPKTSVFHLHRALSGVSGNINDFEAEIQNLKVFESVLQQAISDKTGLSIEDIQAKWFEGNEHYMNAETANEFGFVDVLEETSVEPPAAINKLENMNYKEVMDLYKKPVEAKAEKSFLKRVAALIKPSNNDKNFTDMSDKIVFKAKLTVLLALIGLEQFVLNSSNKVEMSIDETFKINDALEARDREISGLKDEKVQLEEKVSSLEEKVKELQDKIDGTAQEAVNPKNLDNSKDKDKKPVVDLDDETSKALHEYNKSKGLCK